MNRRRNLRFRLISLTAVILVLIGLFTACGNKQIIDTTKHFDYAIIELPNGEVVEGKVSSWSDFEDGDQLQVKVNGKTYLTDTTRCVLIAD